MKLRAFRRRSLRQRLVWLALLALLFQQLALVAYACPLNGTQPAPRPMMMAGCEGMQMPDPASPALCDQHCLRDHATTTDLQSPQVPALALPPMLFALVANLLPSAQAQHYESIPTCRSDPPPAQRFCSLQI